MRPGAAQSKADVAEPRELRRSDEFRGAVTYDELGGRDVVRDLRSRGPGPLNSDEAREHWIVIGAGDVVSCFMRARKGGEVYSRPLARWRKKQ